MSRKICEIDCGATGEAFIPQSLVKGSSLIWPGRVRGNSERPLQQVVTNISLPVKIVNVNAALLGFDRNSRTPRGTERTSCHLFASGTNSGTSPPDLRLCSAPSPGCLPAHSDDTFSSIEHQLFSTSYYHSRSKICDNEVPR